MILSLLLSWYILFIFASSSAFVLRHTIVDGATHFSLTPFLSHRRCEFIVCRDIPNKSPRAFFVPAAAIAMLYFSIVGYLRRSCSVFPVISYPPSAILLLSFSQSDQTLLLSRLNSLSLALSLPTVIPIVYTFSCIRF